MILKNHQLVRNIKILDIKNPSLKAGVMQRPDYWALAQHLSWINNY
jgi:hypothetical protein